MNHSPHVLIVSHDVVGSHMAGPGIRYWELAHVLARHVPVTLAVPGDSDVESTVVSLRPYCPDDWDSLAPAVAQARAILLCGDVLAWFPMLESAGVPLIVDGYDPHTLEALALFSGTAEQEKRHQDRECILQIQCRAGDFFICASERQRDWWLGLLEATGRINVHTYNDDPSLRELIDVVPFGLPSKPPVHTKQVLKGMWSGIGPEDEVILWGGGLWEWLDPLTAIRAMARVRERRDDVRLVFPGTRHPNAAVPDMPMVDRAVELAETLELLNTHVFFGDWVPYEEWANYLLEADVALSLHFDTLETRMAYRSRVLDYVWARLPMVVARGDAISDVVARFELGAIVDYEAEDEVAKALLYLLERPDAEIDGWFERARMDLTWERAAEPLVAFCQEPRYAPDRDKALSVSLTPDNGQLEALQAALVEKDTELTRLRALVSGYESGRFIRLMRWLRARNPWGTVL